MTHYFFCIIIFCISLQRISRFRHIALVSVSYCMQEKSTANACIYSQQLWCSCHMNIENTIKNTNSSKSWSKWRTPTNMSVRRWWVEKWEGTGLECLFAFCLKHFKYKGSCRLLKKCVCRLDTLQSKISADKFLLTESHFPTTLQEEAGL